MKTVAVKEKKNTLGVGKHAIPLSFEVQSRCAFVEMAEPIILSDGEDQSAFATPLPKKPRTLSEPVVLVLDDDPTPIKPSPDIVPETPLSDVSIVKCSIPSSLHSPHRVSISDRNISGNCSFFSTTLTRMPLQTIS